MSEITIQTQDTTKDTPPKTDSMSEVYPVLSGLVQEVFSGERRSTSIKIDTGLWEAVKPVLKRKYGSFCCAVESWFTAELVADRALGVAELTGRVHHGGTGEVTIERFVVNRNLRERRRADPGVLADGFEEVVNEVVEHYESRYYRLGVMPGRDTVLTYLREVYPDIRGDRRIALCDRILKTLRAVEKANPL